MGDAEGDEAGAGEAETEAPTLEEKEAGEIAAGSVFRGDCPRQAAIGSDKRPRRVALII